MKKYLYAAMMYDYDEFEVTFMARSDEEAVRLADIIANTLSNRGLIYRESFWQGDREVSL